MIYMDPFHVRLLVDLHKKLFDNLDIVAYLHRISVFQDNVFERWHPLNMCNKLKIIRSRKHSFTSSDILFSYIDNSPDQAYSLGKCMHCFQLIPKWEQ